MAEKKVEKKNYCIMQDALFVKQDDGSYKAVDKAKEGLTTLKKHATSVTVVCTVSSKEDIETLLKKNEIPYDKVVKLEEPCDFLVTGRESAKVYNDWIGALDDIGYQLSREKKEEKSDQKKADSAFDRWLKKTVKTDGCICCD